MTKDKDIREMKFESMIAVRNVMAGLPVKKYRDII